MKVRLMQRIDYWAGIPLCFVFGLINSLLKPFTAAPAAPRRVLFIELSEMGSAILAHSAIHAAGRMAGPENVYFLIFEKNRESVDLLGIIPRENVITIPDENFISFTAGTLKALFRIRKLGIDTTLDLETFSRCTALIGFLSGARNRAGYDNFTDEGLYRGNFLTHRVLYNPMQHMSLNFLSLVLALKSPREDLPLLKENVSDHLVPLPQFTPGEADTRRVSTILEESGFRPGAGRKLVILNPDPGLLSLRGWPVNNYAELVRRVSGDFPDICFALIGLPRSRSYYETIKGLAPGAKLLDLTGKTANLAELMALFSLADALVTNDSGPAHMASMTKIFNIVLYGPESPQRYGPLGTTSTVFFADLSCSPCYSAANHRHSLCTNNVCMQRIPVDGVASALTETLRQNAA